MGADCYLHLHVHLWSAPLLVVWGGGLRVVCMQHGKGYEKVCCMLGRCITVCSTSPVPGPLSFCASGALYVNPIMLCTMYLWTRQQRQLQCLHVLTGTKLLLLSTWIACCRASLRVCCAHDRHPAGGGARQQQQCTTGLPLYCMLVRPAMPHTALHSLTP